MNAIIVSTLLGVIMMFCSWGIQSQKAQKNILKRCQKLTETRSIHLELPLTL